MSKLKNLNMRNKYDLWWSGLSRKDRTKIFNTITDYNTIFEIDKQINDIYMMCPACQKRIGIKTKIEL